MRTEESLENEDFKGIIGFEADEAESALLAKGFEVKRVEYASLRGIEGADSQRVIRVRPVGNNMVEMIVSRFKTEI